MLRCAYQATHLLWECHKGICYAHPHTFFETNAPVGTNIGGWTRPLLDEGTPLGLDKVEYNGFDSPPKKNC